MAHKTNEKLQTKLVVFDFDGTLTTTKAGGNSWRHVWEEIGKVELDDFYYNEYMSGKFDSRGWSDRVIEEFRKSGVNQQLLNRVADKMSIRDGIEETFAYLKSHGVKIYVFSGGIKQLLNACLKHAMPYIDGVECEEFVFDKDGFVCDSVKTEHDTEDKRQFVLELAEQLGIKPSEIFFMGNGVNDEKVHQTGATTLCVNPDKTDPHNKNCWDYYIEDIKNLKEILQYIK